jgi:hypothetical protein
MTNKLSNSISISYHGSGYYRATSDEILKDYLKAVPFLTISSEIRLQRQMEQVVEQSRNDNAKINYRNGNVDLILALSHLLCSDLIA